MFTNQSDFDEINKEVKKLFQKVFLDTPEARYREFTKVMPTSGKTLEFGGLGGMAPAADWTGAAERSPLRFDKLSFEVRPYQATLPIPMVDYYTDKEGLIADAIASRMESFKSKQLGDEKLVFDTIVAGLTELAEDGVAHFSTNHVGPDGTTQANRDSNAVSRSTLKTAFERMAGYVDRDTGVPIGGGATHVLCGPSKINDVKEVIALQTLTASAGGNVLYQEAVPVVMPWFKGTYANCALVVDASDPESMPLGIGVAKEWDIQMLPTDHPRLDFQIYGLKAYARGHWTKSYWIGS